MLRRGSTSIAFLAVPDGETQNTVNNSLTFGLLWLDRLRNTDLRGNAGALRLIVPINLCGLVAHRLACLANGAEVELYEHDASREVLEKIDPRRAGNLHTRLIPHRESETLLAQARATIEPTVERLLLNLQNHRHPLAADTRHALYRAQPERWLEAIVRQDVTRIDAVLDARFVYTQVFAGSGAEHGIIDVLTITRAGRLAILELKASEHIHLPMQAADYGLRCVAIWNSANSAAMVIFPAWTSSTRPRSFISLLPRCVSIRSPEICCAISRGK